MNNSDEMYELMIDKETLKGIERAAKLKGLTLSAFLDFCIADGVNRAIHLENVIPKIFP